MHVWLEQLQDDSFAPTHDIQVRKEGQAKVQYAKKLAATFGDQQLQDLLQDVHLQSLLRDREDRTW
jgi:hypothetical protein